MPDQKICRYCGKNFTPDARVGDRQKCCGSLACKKARKKEANHNWRKKNPEYFKGRYQSYLKPWLKKHPNYLKNYRIRKKSFKTNDIQDKILFLKIQPLINRSQNKPIDIEDEITSILSIIPIGAGDIQDKRMLCKALIFAP